MQINLNTISLFNYFTLVKKKKKWLIKPSIPIQQNVHKYNNVST